MPNTLVHFGLQGSLSGALFRRIDPRFVYLACVLPDVPWILRRVLARLASLDLDPLDVRLYAMAQSSLLCTLLLCGALALLTRRAGPVFVVLAANSLLHLLIDATEIKWGSGVHLFAPLSFELTQLGWLWPDSRVVSALTLLGLAVVVVELARRPPPAIGLALEPRRLVVSFGLASAYLALPIAWMPAVEASGSYSIDVLRRPELRPGRSLAVDRDAFLRRDDGGWLELWNGERFRAQGATLDHDARVSMRGRFVDAQTVWIDEIHEHQGVSRDLPTYLAFLLLIALWLRPCLRSLRRGRGTTDEPPSSTTAAD
jgi:hypothetical protein